ncbi:Serine/threonine-protein kinase prp4 [Sparassis crispa]|uniref:non-specific serine/threonine protein kinase n=1 Tax=Sparassis crispa TaxID=139825 RepID=A0A401GL18_9APHY|nr:Serine/threonine-protein kinase prp4 [Sparassis crispa]GBE82867.1 Serine/threonine-protein kinase prp4 [Sparassis crispa]
MDPRDWRDVHLRSPRRKPPHSRRESSGRRDSIDRRPRGDYVVRSREYDSRHSGDYGRDRDRRDNQERERDRDYHSRREDVRRDDQRRDDNRRRTPPAPREHHSAGPSNDRPHAPRDESEKEEGEISPRPSRGPTPVPSQPTRAPSPLPQEKPQPQPEHEMELDLSGSPPSAETTLAARRAKRRAILAKYAGIASTSVSQTASPSPGPTSAVEPPTAFSSVSNPVSHINSIDGTPGVSEAPTEGKISKRESESVSPTPASFSLAKDGDEEDVQAKAQAQNGVHEQISAADYDPSLDRREDEQKRVRVKEEPTSNVEDVEEIEVEEDEIDDMFAAVTSEKNVKKVKKIVRTAAPALITTTLDSAADPEGYYQIILGAQLDGGRYQVYSSLGKGMFANVVRARVIHGEVGDAGKEVAIKIVRCQESMYRAGLKEVQILNKLKQADPEDKKHIVRLERTFEHRGHLCLVFESLSMNLRDVVKRFGKDVGLNIKAVRAYAHQLFLAMSLLRKCNIMHADIKPDNILVNEHKTLLKLCDLGSASDASENEITPYLVSRFYRAPEIILGVPYDPALDIWSIGCTLYELYTGKILFPGRSNNQMLLLMMELKGRFNTKMIKKAKFGEMYFDELGGFGNIEQDRVTGSNVVRKVHITTPTRDLRQRLMPPTSVKLKDDEAKLLSSFVDLLDKCLALDPARRITPKEALLHPFIRG